LKTVLLTLLVLISAQAVIPTRCPAGGILHVFPPTVKDETIAVARPAVLLSRSAATVSESNIEYRIDQTFYNDNDFALDCMYVLPLEKGQADASPEVKVDGLSVPCTITPADQFFPTLRRLTTATRDPSLLALSGKDVLTVRPLKIGIRQQKSFRIQFQTPLSIDKDVLEICLPLDGERYSVGPVGELEIRVRYKMSRPLRTIFSCSHHIAVFREAPHRCLVSVQAKDRRVREDFRLLTTFSGDNLDLRSLTYRPSGRQGVFALFVEPPVSVSAGKDSDKDIVFLADCSGSMGRVNFELAKRAIVRGLETLRPSDRFNVITVTTTPTKMADQLLPATEHNVLEAVRFVNSLKSQGGTDLYNALTNALEQFGPKQRNCVVMLVGDGRSTVGITDPNAIAEQVSRSNKSKARIFALALGELADVALLDRVAASTKGATLRYAGKEEFAAVLGQLFANVTPPQVSDLSLRFENLAPQDLEPPTIPDLVGQESLLVLGLYGEKQDVQGKVRLRGRIKGKPRSVTKTLSFPLVDQSQPGIHALWAMRRMARLLEREWLQGEDLKSSGEIESLAREFGFRLTLASALSSISQATGKPAGEAGQLFWLLKTSLVPADVESDHYARAAGRVFQGTETGWLDSEYRTTLPVRKIKFLSKDYFDLLAKTPDLGPYFALGPDVTLVQGDAALHVTSHSVSPSP